METFSMLLALCAGNSLLTSEFPARRPVTRSFDVFFDLHLNKRLSKQSWGWWFETPLHPLWRHCNGYPQRRTFYDTQCPQEQMSDFSQVCDVDSTAGVFAHYRKWPRFYHTVNHAVGCSAHGLEWARLFHSLCAQLAYVRGLPVASDGAFKATSHYPSQC